MVVQCCVSDCRNKGRFRIKNKDNIPNIDWKKVTKVPRICEAHNNVHSHEEFTDVEYLDEYFETNEESEFENSCEETVDLFPITQSHVDSTSLFSIEQCDIIFCKLLLVILIVVAILREIFSVKNENRLIKFNAKTEKIKCDLQTKTLVKQNQVFSEKIKQLQTENRLLKLSSRRVITECERQANQVKDTLGKLFNDDQIELLYSNSKRPQKWSEETILKSLKTKFACKTSGYNHLISEGFPNPSLRTLRRKLEGVNFEPGILDDVFTFLEVKVQHFNEHDKQCYLVIDEVSIIEGTQYDIGAGSYTGEITLPLAKSTDSVVATHSLVFMLVGLSSRYKQVVAYHFTGNSVSGLHLRTEIYEIVRKAWKIGLFCRGMVSDMGGSNGTLWNLWQIKASRNGKMLTHYIPHPCDQNQKFYVIADAPHLIKRIVQGILNNNVVTFDNCIVTAYNLSSNSVRSDDFFELFTKQQDDQLKLAPKLKSHVLSPNNFQKMNVPVSTNLIGSNVSTGLYLLYSDLKPNEKVKSTYETTAWFCQILTRWFKIMTSRHVAMSINKSNYNEVAKELNDIIEIMKHAKFGNGHWKPFQRGLIVSTNSMLRLSSDLLDRNFDFVLPGRTTQDCVENLFSIVRSDNAKPNALQLQSMGIDIEVLNIAHFSQKRLDRIIYAILGNYYNFQTVLFLSI